MISLFSAYFLNVHKSFTFTNCTCVCSTGKNGFTGSDNVMHRGWGNGILFRVGSSSMRIIFFFQKQQPELNFCFAQIWNNNLNNAMPSQYKNGRCINDTEVVPPPSSLLVPPLALHLNLIQQVTLKYTSCGPYCIYFL